MKLIYENNDVSFEQILSETAEKKYRIKGVFSSPGKKNKNGRIYPMNIWEREVQKYQEHLNTGHPNTLMELNHPPRTHVDMMEAVAKMEKLWIENGYVYGEAVLLDNEKANQLKTLIDNGIKMSVSSRGVGSVKGDIVENFNLVNFDIIPNLGQSDYSAEMYGIVEGVLQDKNFLITESGEIVETAENEILEANQKILDAKYQTKINQIFYSGNIKTMLDIADKIEDKKDKYMLTTYLNLIKDVDIKPSEKVKLILEEYEENNKLNLSDFEKKLAQEKFMDKFSKLMESVKSKPLDNSEKQKI